MVPLSMGNSEDKNSSILAYNSGLEQDMKFKLSPLSFSPSKDYSCIPFMCFLHNFYLCWKSLTLEVVFHFHCQVMDVQTSDLHKNNINSIHRHHAHLQTFLQHKLYRNKLKHSLSTTWPRFHFHHCLCFFLNLI